MSAFQRRLDILQYLPRQPRKISVEQLIHLLEQAGHQQVNIRTIQRDLVALEQMGWFGVESDQRSKPFGWYISASWKQLNLNLMDANTALAFNVLNQVGAPILPDSTLAELAPYFSRAQRIIDSEASSWLHHWSQSVAMFNSSLPISLPEPDKDTLHLVKEALLHKKQISAKIKRILPYPKTGEYLWKLYDRVNLLGLIYKDGSPMIICTFGTLHPRIYGFPLGFIKEVSITEQTVQTPN